MSRWREARRRSRGEQGSILVLTALLLPALVAVAALVLGTTTLWTTHEDAQRGVDLGALAGASNTPTASVATGSATLPLAIAGLSLVHDLDDVLTPTDWRDRPCQVLTNQLAADRSPVVRASKGAGDATKCASTWQYESPTLAAVAACAANLLDVAGCDTSLHNVLSTTLPLLSATTPALTAVNQAAATVTGQLTSTTDHLVTDLLNLPIVGPLLRALTVPVLGQQMSLGTARVGVGLDGLLPAVLTPRVQTRLYDAKVHPTLSPFTFDMSATATARRAIKSALVLPSLGIPATDATDLVAKFGSSATNQLVLKSGSDGYIVDPNDITRMLTAADPIGKTLDLIDAVNGAIDSPLLNAFTSAACGHAPASTYCPSFDTVAATTALRQTFLQDVRDAATPPPTGNQPTIQEILDGYATSGEPVWGLAGLLRVPLNGLVSGLGFIPALDVAPVVVEKTIVAGKAIYTLDRVNLNDLTAATGLFQGRLVK